MSRSGAAFYVTGQTRRFVSPTGSDSNDGRSEGEAKLSLQAALDDAPANAEIVLVYSGNSQVYTSPVIVSKPVKITAASPYGTRVMFNGCDGFTVSSAASGSTFSGFEVAQATRYSTTANTARAFVLSGTSGTYLQNLVLRDLYVDGFQTGIESYWLWASTLDNVRTNFGLIGIDAYGKSVNNFVGHGQFGVSGGAGSRAIRLNGYDAPNGNPLGSEGWHIHDNLTNGAEVGVELVGYTHCDIHDNIVDFNTKQGVLIRDNGTNFGGNTRVAGNYIALTGSAGRAAIECSNTVSNTQNTINRITDNHCLTYDGSATGTYGLASSGTYSQVVARGNVFRNFTNDVFLAGAGNVVTGNACYSTSATGNIYNGNGVYLNTISDNIGTVYMSFHRIAKGSIGGTVMGMCDQVPTTGTWKVGDRVINNAPAVGSPKSWVCTVAGTPGTWVSEGNL